jgi:6-phospho-3-hexuloisomerase
MKPELIKSDVNYQKSQLDELEKELISQPEFFRLVDDIVARRGPKVTLKLPKKIKLNTDDISVKYDLSKLKGRVEYTKGEPEIRIKARTIHIYGAGRSGLEARALTMRLIHLGFDASEPGSTTARPVKRDDLAIFFSGSWGTMSTTNYAKAAKQEGATTVAITSHPELARKCCDYAIKIGGREESTVRDYYVESLKGKASTTLDPMGTVYEFKLAAFKDILIHYISERLGEKEHKMRKRHVKFE